MMDAENTLRNIIAETVRKKINELLNEGIDIDYQNNIVSYNPSHERNVDTSIANNPTHSSGIANGVTVWSIFKRRKGLRGDGNPLIYALKGENGWRFRSEEDERAVFQQFDTIATKFGMLYPIGVTIVIPSGSDLNERIAALIASKSPNAQVISGAVIKITTEEVFDTVMMPNSEFKRFYNTKEKFERAFRELQAYLDDMDRERDGMFSRHLVKNSQMRNVLNRTMKASPSSAAVYAKLINGEDVLIIDDTVSRGQTIREACEIIQDTYAPKSITVLTLLSKL